MTAAALRIARGCGPPPAAALSLLLRTCTRRGWSQDLSQAPPAAAARRRCGCLCLAAAKDGGRAASGSAHHRLEVPKTPHQLEVRQADPAKARLDVFLSQSLENVTRARLQRCIRDGLVDVNGVTCTKGAAKVAPGDVVQVSIQPGPPMRAVPEDIPLDIIHEDDHVIVVNKEAGMVTHPAPGNYTGTLVNAILGHCGLPENRIENTEDDEAGDDIDIEEEADPTAEVVNIRPGIVHRLDKGTSGLLVVAKTDAALQSLALQFKDRTVNRTYVSITLGVPRDSQGRVEANVGRDPNDRKRMAAFPYTKDNSRQGRHAASNFKVLEELCGGRAAVVAWKLDTGRTHQIRVHAKHLGHPLFGDDAYGGGGGAATDRISRGNLSLNETVSELVADLGRPALHAATLGFVHPEAGEDIKFSIPVPRDMMAVIETLREARR